MPDLRPCKFKHQTNHNGVFGISKEKEGLFHQWGNDYEECSIQGFVPFVVGVVEDKLSGKVYRVNVETIQFLDK